MTSQWVVHLLDKEKERRLKRHDKLELCLKIWGSVQWVGISTFVRSYQHAAGELGVDLPIRFKQLLGFNTEGHLDDTANRWSLRLHQALAFTDQA